MRRAAWIALALVLASCAEMQRQRDADRPFRSGTITRASDGSIQRARLIETATLDGIECVGWVAFHPGGRLHFAELARDVEIAGARLPEGSRVFLDRDGRLSAVQLSRATTLAGVPCAGGPLKIATSFHPDGKLAAAFLAEDATIDGVPCEASLFVPVRFDAEGNLVGCSLARDAVIAGERFPAGATVAIAADGRARRVER